MAFQRQQPIHTPAGTLTAPNTISQANGWHLSYNGSVAGYGCVTTALSFNDRMFFVLCGDHRAAWETAAGGDINNAVGYFIAHGVQAHKYSEHLQALGLSESDPLNCRAVLADYIDTDRVAALREAFRLSTGE